ncbi:helix-turn-helix domain-containing protein [Paenibacillus lautus]|uniref:helix-turn-helix domain-containing protein n=1 Tax=Paenibacillus lautus TaxID=1401 RepID=UPI003D9A1200
MQEFIRNQLDEDLSLVRLTEQVYLNPSYISRIYKQETGNNLKEFIDSTRLMQAKRLLHSENLRVGEVARRVGYETASSFTRFLKRPPAVHRRNTRKCIMIQKP